MKEISNETKDILTRAHKTYANGLSTYASFKVCNSGLSEDLVQDTFIKTWSYLVKGGEIIKMKAFLYHVLNGLIIDEYRKRKNMSLDVLIEHGYEVPVDETERDSAIFDGKIAIELISKLPVAYQKNMKLRYIQDLTLTEIASKTGKTKNTAAVHSHRGLEKLKVLYFHQYSTTS